MPAAVDDNEQLRSALSRAQAAADAKRREVQLVADVGRMLVGRGPIAAQLARAVEAVGNALRASSVRIFLVDEDDQCLILVAGAGRLAPSPLLRLEVSSPAGNVARHGRPLVVDLGEDDAERGGTFAGMPLVVDGRIAGVLCIVADEDRIRTTLDLLGIIADQIALAVARAR